MKKFLIGFVTVALLSCGENKAGTTDSVTGEGTQHGVSNDGMNTLDTNGALNDNGGPLTDSTGNAIENKTRTDIQQRDTFTTPGQ